MDRSERAKGIQIHRPIMYGNSAYPIASADRAPGIPAEHTHRWTVAVRSPVSVADKPDNVGGADDLSYFIQKVQFKLHETYVPYNRVVEKPPFEISETGWGEFEIVIRITFVKDSGEKPVQLHHHLKLHPWVVPDTESNPQSDPAILIPSTPPQPAMPNEVVHAWQYDEVIFSDPTKLFLDTLLQHPPTPLPKISAVYGGGVYAGAGAPRRRAMPANPAYPKSLGPPTARGAPEFTMLTEKEEADRLDEAKRKIVEEFSRQRQILAEKEKEYEKMKAEAKALGVPEP